MVALLDLIVVLALELGSDIVVCVVLVEIVVVGVVLSADATGLDIGSGESIMMMSSSLLIAGDILVVVSSVCGIVFMVSLCAVRISVFLSSS